jgi:hypothetical protein
MRAKLMLVAMLALPVFAGAQTVDKQKLDSFASAVAHAEGFGVPHAIPTRYHNPGNIRSTRNGHRYAGQVGLNRCGYVIFKSDAYGWAALKEQLTLMASGQSEHYGTGMTITQVAKRYATGWRLWSKNVAKILGVTPDTTLAEFFAPAPQYVLEQQPVQDADFLLPDFAAFANEFQPAN